MKAITTVSPLMNRAAMPPPPDPSIPKKNISVRVELAISLSLDSMARVLGKTPSGLGAELMEAAVTDFSNSLSQLRPDLVRPLTDEERELAYNMASYEHEEPDLLPVPTWLSPGAARSNLESQRTQEQPQNLQAEETE
jgi:pyruvate/oxaloacetate carboxyltransferase